MQFIDLENWNRRHLFEWYKTFDCPQLSLTVNLNITKLYKTVKQKNYPFFLTVLYCLLRAANEIPEFRMRLIEDKPADCQRLFAITPILSEDNIFETVELPFKENLVDFISFSAPIVKAAKEIQHNNSKVYQQKPDCILVSNIPWFSFTAMSSAFLNFHNDGLPVLATGKFFQQGNELLLPLSMQLNHMFIDGVHIGRFLDLIQSYANNL